MTYRITNRHNGILDKIISDHGQWAVTNFGIENVYGSYHYYLAWSQVGDEHWKDHMAEKNWVIPAHFNAALDAAREYLKSHDAPIPGPYSECEICHNEEPVEGRFNPGICTRCQREMPLETTSYNEEFAEAYKQRAK